MGTAGQRTGNPSDRQTSTEALLRVDARRESAVRLPDSRGTRVPRTDPPGSSNNDHVRHVRKRVRDGPSNPAVRCRYRAACYRHLPGRQSGEPVPFGTRAIMLTVREPTPYGSRHAAKEFPSTRE